MRQVGRDEYGMASAVIVREVPVPEPGPGEVRIRVHSSSVNKGDLLVMTGTPYIMNSSANRLITSSLVMLRETSSAMQRRVYSSTIESHFNECPLVVRSKMKSQVQTWFIRSARRRWQAFLDLPFARFFFGLRRTFSPSAFQIRCTRLKLTRKPSRRSSLVI